MSYGATIDGCLKRTERYSGKVVYENALAKTVGGISVTDNTLAGLNTHIRTVFRTAVLNSAMVYSIHDNYEDGFSVQIKFNHPSGEKYTVTDT
ncbi:hypothetical protein ACKUB1_12855 [Methanospirillum stamsii]|uniref:Uncharacterized protein n=1 Tax=Methanospirillum stamsii TaxID=1277351 RepID=A0A2V2N8F4_9EURY|nr:hypothetical protein [Methanospirillum stamsii]PWR76282.1 hypothetical protein DLD82_00285 [Methanospirillum stamsii]